MTFLQVTIEGNVKEKLAKLSTVLSPVSIGEFLHETVDQILRDRIENRFKDEGDDASGKWAPLSKATQSIRASLNFGPAHPINVRTGQMKSFATDADSRIITDNMSVTLRLPGTKPTGKLQKKIRVAQRGDGRTPARPILALSETDAALTLTALETYIRAGVG